MHYSMILVCLSMIVQTPCRWSTRIPSAMRISASSRPMLNGSFKNTNPTSRTTLTCVAVMTGEGQLEPSGICQQSEDSRTRRRDPGEYHQRQPLGRDHRTRVPHPKDCKDDCCKRKRHARNDECTYGRIDRARSEPQEYGVARGHRARCEGEQ